MEKRRKKTYIIFLVGFIIGVLLFTGSFLMYLNANQTGIIIIDSVGDEEFVPNGLVFNSIDDSLHLESVIPTLDKFGQQEKGFSFSIKNNNLRSVIYELSLADDNSTIKNSNIRYQLIKNDEVLGIYTLADDGVLETAVIKEKELVKYTIKLWLDYNSEVIVGKLSKRISIKEVKEIKTNISKPVLTNGMIPVYYDNNTNSWHKADSNNLSNRWYSYEDNIWANVVTVDIEKRDYYENSSVGTRIEASDINSMWVWIPRFNYEINSNEINVRFVSEKEKAFKAFNFDNKELTGFWFSKLEAGLKEDDECITSGITKICNNSNNKLYFVPNYPFATKTSMVNIFYAIRKMELKNNIYGFNGTGTKLNNDGTITGDTNDIDIHMVKNSEWDAVALLSSSKYGNKKITNNNSSITGKAGIEYDYNVLSKGEAASTTGNVYGIYDMAGGKREYVMVNTNEIIIFNKASNSGFTTSVKDYYYDSDLELTTKLKDKYGTDNLINNEPVTRGGYKNTGNIFSIYGANDYIDKVSVETNSRACLVIKGEE